MGVVYGEFYVDDSRIPADGTIQAHFGIRHQISVHFEVGTLHIVGRDWRMVADLFVADGDGAEVALERLS